ncbi:phage tail sheath C-terminal domain-containing protein [Escherichia coli]|nr:phage tail sheath subtilisin-like domain-containing protein [Escherichia coli]ELJ0493445.1 phage tail sheath subtilisin-like domain-containing protein [Escherichia coli O2]EJH1128673.1 phage tail sheath subtilisin-like domain-containing protein [Escherichia coli]HAP3101428.1 phage tail protein [Escherichia coli]HAP3110023.1 phage tail protein [Escherichia coli]
MSEIQFDTISGGIRKPGVHFEFNTRLAVNTLPGNEQRVLVIGPMLSGGTATPLNAVSVYSEDEADLYFGAGSLAAAMARAAINANSYLQLDVIGIADSGAGKAATGAVTVNGTAISSGTLSVWVAGEQVTVDVETGDEPSKIIPALVEAMAQTPSLLVTGEYKSETSQLTVTTRTKGAWGNDITLSASTTAGGLTVSATPMANGEMDPDIQPALDAVFAAGHNILICPFSTAPALAALKQHLEKTGNAMEQRGAIGCAGWTGSLGNGITLAAGVNSGRVSVPWYRGSVKLPAVLAAIYGAVMASEEDPARPLNSLALSGLDVVAMSQRESRNEQENALHNGLTPVEVGPGNTVQIVRAVSTYTVNAQGVTDVSLLDITSIRTLDYTRKACRERISLRFPREKLSTRTIAKVESELYDVLIKLEEAEILENVEANKAKLRVQRNGKDANRLDCVVPADVVNGLHVFAGRIDMIL